MKRYALGNKFYGGLSVPEIVEREDGEYVRYEDVKDALQDKARIDWLADDANDVGSVLLPTECVTENIDSLRAAIDAAMGMGK